MRVSIVVLAVCLSFFFSMKYSYAENKEIIIKTPYLEMQPNNIDLVPLPPKVGPGGDGEISIVFINH